MDSEAFRRHGNEMINLVANYWSSLENGERRPLPAVKPGFMRELIPDEPPSSPEQWAQIFEDIDPVVLQGNTNWHHPDFFAYYPTAISYAAIMGDILSGGVAAIGFSWKSSPSMTELERSMLDWLAKAIGLPPAFWNSDPGPGLGMIQSTASDATLVALLSARARAVTALKSEIARKPSMMFLPNGVLQWSPNVLRDPLAKALNKLTDVGATLKNSIRANGNALSSIFKAEGGSAEKDIGQLTTFEAHDSAYFDRLVAYCSDQAHSSVDKGMMLCGVKMRKLPTTRENNRSNFVLEPQVLEAAIKQDRANGLCPFILVVTVGTTNTCAVESIRQLGPICNREGIWVHVDAAYAGSFLLCEEFRYLADGVEFADSFNFNAHKAMMINFDCSPMWFKNGAESIAYFNVDPVYLKHEHQTDAYDYRHLQVALGRRFRALKIWFVLRAIGIQRIQQYQRRHVELAEMFADLLLQDDLFELFVPQHLGLVCFRMKTSNELNEALGVAINEDGRIHLVASQTHGTYFLRFAVCSAKTSEEHIGRAVAVIREIAARVQVINGIAAKMGSKPAPVNGVNRK